MPEISSMFILITGVILLLIIIPFILVAMFYKKVPQGKALVRTGFKGAKVGTGKGLWVVPVFHRVELMDISVRKIEIERMGTEGLI